ncbi:MAG: DUF2079 domain-containing protein, partial [Rubrobacter sp.]
VYLSSRFDLGNMDQAVWNSSEGRPLEATDENGELTSRLKNHADFLLFLFAPLYWIAPSVHWLLAAQAAVVALGALPLYWLARRFLQRDWPAALIAAAYLLNPGLQSANLFDFHAQTMAGTFLLFAFYFLLEKRLLPFALCAVLAASTKEGIVLVVAMMGLYAVYPLRRPRWGVLILALGTAYFLAILLLVIPAFNAGEVSMLVEERYEVFGGSLGGVVRTALTDPVFTLRYVLAGAKGAYLASLVAPTGFLAMLAPHLLLIPLPELAVNLLSERPQMTDTRYHYSAPIVPFVYLAAAVGVRNLLLLLERAKSLRHRPFDRLGRLVPGRTTREKLLIWVCIAILVTGFEIDYRTGPLPLFRSPANDNTAIEPAPASHREALHEAVALVPEDPEVEVSATNALGPHLSYRTHLYLFPRIEDADYVIVDQVRPAYDTNNSTPVLNLQSVRRLRDDPRYGLIFDENGVLVFEKKERPGVSLASS